MSDPVPSLGELLSEEQQTDQYYGFPAGTMEALGGSETSQGANLGTIGNVFQVLPSTAMNPGYGLGYVDGNNPMSVGAYLNALINRYGSVQGGLAAYQGRPQGSTGNSVMSAFLASLAGGNPTAAQMAPAGLAPSLAGASSGLDTTTGQALQIGGAVLGVLFILVGIVALALGKDPVSVVVGGAQRVAETAGIAALA